jgi:nucleoside-diphosphate-sugar epimerase
MQGSVFRPLGIYGPRDTRFLKLFRGLKHRRFVMIGDGSTLYHMTYIDDLCQGIELCGTRPEALGEVFILGGDHHVTLNELIASVARAVESSGPRMRVPMWPVMAAAHVCEKVFRPLGIEPPLYPRRVEFFSKDRAADISKARRLLGYAPRVNLDEGTRRTARWYAEQNLL